MTNQEAKMIACQVVKHLEILLGQPKCQWINEETVLKEFPFSKDQLRRLRDSAGLEFKYHFTGKTPEREKVPWEPARVL